MKTSLTTKVLYKYGVFLPLVISTLFVNTAIAQSSNTYQNSESPIVENSQVFVENTTQPFPQNPQNINSPVANPSQIKLSLKEAIEMLLKDNLDILSAKNQIKKLELDIKGNRGIYDTRLTAFFQYNLDSFPITSTLTRSSATFTNITGTKYNYNGGISKLYRPGGRIGLDFENSRLRTDSAFDILGLQYKSKITFSYNQPLLRNFRINENRRDWLKLQRKLNIFNEEVRQVLVNLVADTEASYYNLAFAIKKKELIGKFIEEASEQLRLSKLRLEAGRGTRLEVVSRETELELKKDDLLLAELEIKKAENKLKNLILGDPDNPVWQLELIPTDQIEFIPTKIDKETAIQTAIENKPELKKLELEEQINKVQMDYLNNQSKPQLDIFSAFSVQNLNGQRNQNSQAPNDFIGNFFEGLGGIYKYRGYVVGATFSINLGKRSIKADLAKVNVSNRQIKTKKDKIIQSVSAETSNAIYAIELAEKRIAAAKSVVADAESQLKAEMKRYEAGVSTLFMVSKYRERLLESLGNELLAKVEYIKAYSELKRVMSSNLP